MWYTKITPNERSGENEKQNILYAWYAPLYRQGDRPNVQHWTMLKREPFLAEAFSV